jgi:hypothetical protein
MHFAWKPIPTRNIPPIPNLLTCRKHLKHSSAKSSTNAPNALSSKIGAALLTWACTPTRNIKASNIYGRMSSNQD